MPAHRDRDKGKVSVKNRPFGESPIDSTTTWRFSQNGVGSEYLADLTPRIKLIDILAQVRRVTLGVSIQQRVVICLKLTSIATSDEPGRLAGLQ